jgi:hypothetical protein
MSVRDHGLEVLKKSGLELIPGNKAEYALRVGLAPEGSFPDTGTTTQYAATVGTSPISIPSSPGAAIRDCLIRNPSTNTPHTKTLLVSFDAGATFLELSPGEYIGWTPRGSVAQIVVKGSTAGVKYEALLNRGAV